MGVPVTSWMPCLVRPADAALSLGHPVVDDYLRFVKARVRPNSLLAVAFDLKVFFEVVGREPVEVTTRDVLAFIEAQRQPRRGSNVVRIDDGEQGLSARTVKRRLSSVSGLFAFLAARGDVDSNPVPRGLSTRRVGRRGVPLIRAPHTLPRVLEPQEATALLAALRTHRDRAMVEAMLFGALRRCEVLGLRLQDLRLGEHRVFVTEGKGGHQRLVPVAPRFFTTVADYLAAERPRTSVTDRLFVVLKGKRRGLPLSAAGLDEILSGARSRGCLEHASCHELRHTCLTRLREAGMALEAVQAQAGHRSIESTRIYLHLSNGWLVEEYRRAMDVLDALPVAEPRR